MKRIAIFASIFAVLVVVGFDFIGVVDQFSAAPDGDGITLNWESGIETGIASYSVQRADISSVNDFSTVSNVTATGNYSYYKYHDNHISGIAHAGSGNQTLSDAYKYRLQINLTSGDVSYSQTVSVTKPASGVRRTWGMIKEMFH